jgi:hypothetical protein
MLNSRRISLYLKTLLVLILFIYGCTEKPPVVPDGNAGIRLLVLYDSTGNYNNTLRVSNAKVVITSDYGAMIKYTDKDGMLAVDNIPCANYNISVTANLGNDKNVVLSGRIETLSLKSDSRSNDTIYVKPFSNTGIVFNELYFDAPINNSFYCWDQFIELYNSSDSVQYLDGIQIIRMKSGGLLGAGADEDNDGDVDAVLHISKFPGKPGEKNYPLKPKSFLVLAVDAINHSSFIQGAVDLTHADWEFYNQYSADDIDNPEVPNLLNIQPEMTKDFFMPLDIGVIILANGRDSVWQDGIDINTILDGAEYEGKPGDRKTLDPRVDRGNFVSPPKYSGKSLQRREPGLDSDNGSLDWEIINNPTSGYQ